MEDRVYYIGDIVPYRGKKCEITAIDHRDYPISLGLTVVKTGEQLGFIEWEDIFGELD